MTGSSAATLVAMAAASPSILPTIRTLVLSGAT